MVKHFCDVCGKEITKANKFNSDVTFFNKRTGVVDRILLSASYYKSVNRPETYSYEYTDAITNICSECMRKILFDDDTVYEKTTNNTSDNVVDSFVNALSDTMSFDDMEDVDK